VVGQDPWLSAFDLLQVVKLDSRILDLEQTIAKPIFDLSPPIFFADHRPLNFGRW
jgi:hypothetical protein